MGCKGNCGCAKEIEDFQGVLREEAYVRFNPFSDIIGVTSISSKSVSEDDFFNDDEEGDSLIVDVDYVAEMLQGLEPQELKYISKLCEVLIAEGEL